MKKVAVLTLVATLNLGGAAGELIFQDGFESGWPNAWAAAVGWSPFVVKDSTDALVGPVVGWWSEGGGSDEEYFPAGVPLVASIIDGEKVVFKTYEEALVTGRELLFDDPDCSGQAYVCIVDCDPDKTDVEVAGESNANLMKRIYAMGEGNVLYKAEPPQVVEIYWESRLTARPTGDGLITSCSNTPQPFRGWVVWPAEPVVDLDTLFTRPFTVE